jgi:Uma2 family endonuclease
MNAVAEKTAYTPEDLLALPDEKSFELVDGQLVERHMGAESSWVGGQILHRIQLVLDQHPIGLVFGADNGLQCFPDDPNKVRKPDLSFVRSGRLPGDRPPEGYLRVAPDLVVEVISPNDLAVEVEQKVAEYLGAGVAVVWVVEPRSRVVRVHRADGSSAWLTEGGELTGDDVLPGFRCRVADVFPRPAAGAGAAG